MLVGQTTFKWWLIQKISRLSLEILTVQVHSEEAETALGVRLNVRSVAQVKVKAFDEDGAGRKINKAKIATRLRLWLPIFKCSTVKVGNHLPTMKRLLPHNNSNKVKAVSLLQSRLQLQMLLMNWMMIFRFNPYHTVNCSI